MGRSIKENHTDDVTAPCCCSKLLTKLFNLDIPKSLKLQRNNLFISPPTGIVKCPSSMLQHMETLKAILTKAAASMDEPCESNE
ncbi:hypothetical protein K0M31_012918 [Melipona bicolor]|uniref:Uncharacterized protein n=1 Tax=Melipona bicolor TaxID=60889 RepID=A0AA40FIT7_9HYME|nr:hypothetical protein K0M31_012918 [Melipona bicolor]